MKVEFATVNQAIYIYTSTNEIFEYLYSKFNKKNGSAVAQW